eukprot:scaffold9782_cov150-Amphora_coffeaeformis.AAC.1
MQAMAADFYLFADVKNYLLSMNINNMSRVANKRDRFSTQLRGMVGFKKAAPQHGKRTLELVDDSYH